MNHESDKRKDSGFRRWGSVALLLLATTLTALVLDTQVSLTSLAMLYVLAVVVASYKLGWLESVVTAVASAAALNFFFVPPRGTFEIESRDNLISLGAMLGVALAISHLGYLARREATTARRHELRAQELQGLSARLGAAQTGEEVQNLGQKALQSAFSGPVVLRLEGQSSPSPDWAGVTPHLDHGLRQCMKEAAVLGPGTGRWPGLDGWFIPVKEGSRIFGAALVQPEALQDEEGREHAIAMVGLVAQALWRLALEQERSLAQHEAQRQQLQSTFLAAISHDLRTPLAAVIGAASSLRAQGQRLSSRQVEHLLDSILSEAHYLVTLADNTLQWVRLGTTPCPTPSQWESIEEVVGATLARVREHDPERRITSNVPAGLPLIQADPVLLGQLLSNLLDNAIRHTWGPITLTAHQDGRQLLLCVKDRGPGISETMQATLFQPFSRSDRAQHRGAGLGLALCNAIAQVHGGTLTLRPRRGGGLSACVSLPVNPQPPQGEAP